MTKELKIVANNLLRLNKCRLAGKYYDRAEFTLYKQILKANDKGEYIQQLKDIIYEDKGRIKKRH